MLAIVSAQAGGWLGQRHVSPRILATFGLIAFGAGLCLAAVSGFEVIGLGLGYLLGGTCAPALYAMAGSYMRPEYRAIGFGIFLTSLYIGFAIVPMAAGAAVRLSGDPAAALLLAAAVTIASAAPLPFMRPSTVESQ